VLLLVTTSNVAYAQTYNFGPTKDTATVQTPTVTLAAGNVGTSTISLNTAATVTITPPPAYVAITITNTQGTATPNPFQQEIAINPSTYSTYEASNIGNIRFCVDSNCVTELYSWLEGCGASAPYGACTPSSTQAIFWVQLTSSIGACCSANTLTIYMVFLPTTNNFDPTPNGHAGESPSLSASYGQYDNGPKVFGFYDNFNGTTLNPKWTTPTGTGVFTIGVNNGATITGVSVASNMFAPWVPPSSGNAAIDSYIQAVSCSNAYTQFLGSGTTASTSSNPNTGYLMGWGFGACVGDSFQGFKSGSSLTLQNSNAGTGTFTNGNYYVTTLAWYGTSFSGSVSPAAFSTATAADNQVAMSGLNQVGAGVRGGTPKFTIYWFRVRTAPPNNVMPTTSAGVIVIITGAPGTAYYENANGPVPCSVTTDTSLTQPGGTGSVSFQSSTCLVSPVFSSSTSIAAGPWLSDLFASGTGNGGTLGVSLQVETSAGAVVATAFSGKSVSVSFSKTEIKNYFSGSAVTVPSGDYLVLTLTAIVNGGAPPTFTVYWGAGQLTNFQQPNTYGYILAVANTSNVASYLIDLGYVSSSNNRLNNMTIFLEPPISKQIIIGTGIGSPTPVNGFGPQVTLAAGTTMYIGLGVTANSAGTTVVTVTLKVELVGSPSLKPYAQDTIAITVN
jgi:hypothetical protein